MGKPLMHMLPSQEEILASWRPEQNQHHRHRRSQSQPKQDQFGQQCNKTQTNGTEVVRSSTIGSACSKHSISTASSSFEGTTFSTSSSATHQNRTHKREIKSSSASVSSNTTGSSKLSCRPRETKVRVTVLQSNKTIEVTSEIIPQDGNPIPTTTWNDSASANENEAIEVPASGVCKEYETNETRRVSLVDTSTCTTPEVDRDYQDCDAAIGGFLSTGGKSSPLQIPYLKESKLIKLASKKWFTPGRTTDLTDSTAPFTSKKTNNSLYGTRDESRLVVPSVPTMSFATIAKDTVVEVFADDRSLHNSGEWTNTSKASSPNVQVEVEAFKNTEVSLGATARSNSFMNSSAAGVTAAVSSSTPSVKDDIEAFFLQEEPPPKNVKKKIMMRAKAAASMAAVSKGATEPISSSIKRTFGGGKGKKGTELVLSPAVQTKEDDMVSFIHVIDDTIINDELEVSRQRSPASTSPLAIFQSTGISNGDTDITTTTAKQKRMSASYVETKDKDIEDLSRQSSLPSHGPSRGSKSWMGSLLSRKEAPQDSKPEIHCNVEFSDVEMTCQQSETVSEDVETESHGETAFTVSSTGNVAKNLPDLEVIADAKGIEGNRQASKSAANPALPPLRPMRASDNSMLDTDSNKETNIVASVDLTSVEVTYDNDKEQTRKWTRSFRRTNPFNHALATSKEVGSAKDNQIDVQIQDVTFDSIGIEVARQSSVTRPSSHTTRRHHTSHDSVSTTKSESPSSTIVLRTASATVTADTFHTKVTPKESRTVSLVSTFSKSDSKTANDDSAAGSNADEVLGSSHYRIRPVGITPWERPEHHRAPVETPVRATDAAVQVDASGKDVELIRQLSTMNREQDSQDETNFQRVLPPGSTGNNERTAIVGSPKIEVIIDEGPKHIRSCLRDDGANGRYLDGFKVDVDVTTENIEVTREQYRVLPSSVVAAEDEITPPVLSSAATRCASNSVQSPGKTTGKAVSDEKPDFVSPWTDHNVDYIAHIDVLGVAGIVVDPTLCKDEMRNQDCPAMPSEILAVVGLCARGESSVSSVTGFSNALVVSPSGNVEHNASDERYRQHRKQHRHVAIWAANNTTAAPGSVIKTRLNDLERVDESDPNSRLLPLFFDLTVALSDYTRQDGRVAIPIGVAKLKISGDIICRGEPVTIDLPVRTLEQSRELNRMNGNVESPFSTGVTTIEVTSTSTNGKRRMAFKNPFRRKFSKLDSILPTQAQYDAFSAAYAIDPSGDAMLRVKVVVERIRPGQMEKTFKLQDAPFCEGKENISNTEPDEMTVETGLVHPQDAELLESRRRCLDVSTTTEQPTSERVADSFMIEMPKDRSDDALQDGTALIAHKRVPTSKVKSKTAPVMGPETTSAEEGDLYSTPVEFKRDRENSSFHTLLSTDGEAQDENQSASPGVKLFGRAITLPSCGPIRGPTAAAQKLDDEIEQVAEKVFGGAFPFSACSSIRDGNIHEPEDLLRDSSFLLKDDDNNSVVHDMSYPAHQRERSYSDTSGKDEEKKDGECRSSGAAAAAHPSVPAAKPRVGRVGRVGRRVGHATRADGIMSPSNLKDFVQERLGRWVVEKGEWLFPGGDPYAMESDGTVSVGDATLEAFVSGQLRMRVANDGSTVGNDDATSTTDASFDTEPTKTSNDRNEGGAQWPVYRPKQQGSNDQDDETFSDECGPRRLNIGRLPAKGMPARGAIKVVGTSVDYEDDYDVAEAEDERSFEYRRPRRQKMHLRRAASAPASAAGVFALYNPCAVFTTSNNDDDNDKDDCDNNNNNNNSDGCATYGRRARSLRPPIHHRPVPETLEPDVLSVGDLTATTLEGRMAAAERARRRKTAMLSHLPPTFGGGQLLSQCSGAYGGVEDDTDDEEVRFVTSSLGGQAAPEGGDTGNVWGAPPPGTENYFAEYEDCGLPRPRSREEYPAAA